MIRAVLRGGVIYPLDSVPSQWADGQELRVIQADATPPPRLDEFEKWHQELETLVAQLNDPQEWEQIEATLAEGDHHAKAAVRRRMGLP